jgi:hypothetical protein
MSVQLDQIKQKFDEEERKFIFWAQATQSEWPSSREEDLVWRGYEKLQASLRTIIDEVVAFIPQTDRETEDKLDLGKELIILGQTLDEGWLEAEAEKILPAPIVSRSPKTCRFFGACVDRGYMRLYASASLATNFHDQGRV